MSLPAKFRAFVVQGKSEHDVLGGLEDVELAKLPSGDVLIKVAYSSLNYKDALAAKGHPGVVRKFPHVPGIDAAGEVIQSEDGRFSAGQSVLVTGYQLGADRWGGWAEYVHVPADWVVPLPKGLTAKQAMAIGTAGFTAVQCVSAIERNGVFPEHGPVVVTGASGGVGSIAVMLLARLGYEVCASTGKPEYHHHLKGLGATSCLSREEIMDASERPLLSARWAAAVDTVGGTTLASLFKSMKHRGCIAACGMVGGTELSVSVFPLILRGVKLLGIDSAQCPYGMRAHLWSRLNRDIDRDLLESITTEHHLADVAGLVSEILNGQVYGRTVLRVSN